MIVSSCTAGQSFLALGILFCLSPVIELVCCVPLRSSILPELVFVEARAERFAFVRAAAAFVAPLLPLTMFDFWAAYWFRLPAAAPLTLLVLLSCILLDGLEPE